MMKSIALILLISLASISCSSLGGIQVAAGGMLQNGESKKLTLADVNAGFAAQKDSPLDVFKTQEVAYTVYGIADVDNYLLSVAKIKGNTMLIAKIKELAMSADVAALKIDSFKDADAMKNGAMELAKSTLEQAKATLETGKQLVLNVATVAAAKPTAVPSITSDLTASVETLTSLLADLSK